MDVPVLGPSGRNIELCTKDEYSLFGSRCAAIVSTSLLDRFQYSSYGTDAVSVEIQHKKSRQKTATVLRGSII